ncbi:site-2 protease family protein [Candidatus Babeliales bacterium]|nr:site-2 protease family protein [Candidatus Babeliales bacterium]
MFFYNFFFSFVSKFLPLLQAILGFSAVIIIHECGHFFFCKVFGIDTPTFSVGMGPTIFQKKFGKTNFRLAALPIGGSVEVLVEEKKPQEGDKQNIGHSLESKPYWQKLLVMLGGILFNLAFALIVFSTLFWQGMPKMSLKKLKSVEVKEVIKNSAAQKTGLKSGDIIIGIQNKKLTSQEISLEKFLGILSGKSSKSSSTTIMVKRASESVTLKIIYPIKNKPFGFICLPEGTYEQLPGKSLPFFTAIKKGLTMTVSQFLGIGKAIKSALQSKSTQGLGGPLAIFSYSMKSAQRGMIALFFFLAILSINLALLNLLPFGIVDGGRILFLTIEAVIRRPVPDIIQIAVNGFSFLAISALLLLLTYRDIINIWFK